MSIFARKNKPEASDYDAAYDTDYYGTDSTYPDESAFAPAENDDIKIEDTPKRTTSSAPSYSSPVSSGSAFAMKLIKPTSSRHRRFPYQQMCRSS